MSPSADGGGAVAASRSDLEFRWSLQGPQQLPILLLWSHIPKMAILSHTSNKKQNDIGNHYGIYIADIVGFLSGL